MKTIIQSNILNFQRNKIVKPKPRRWKEYPKTKVEINEVKMENQVQMSKNRSLFFKRVPKRREIFQTHEVESNECLECNLSDPEVSTELPNDSAINSRVYLIKVKTHVIQKLFLNICITNIHNTQKLGTSQQSIVKRYTLKVTSILQNIINPHEKLILICTT